MVYGVIDKESRPWYTSLGDVFAAIDNRQNDYRWLITDTEILARGEGAEVLDTGVHWQVENGEPIAVPAPRYHVLSGEELSAIVSRDDAQWIWGVLSGFEKKVSLEDILKAPLPETGYEGYWTDPPSMQHPLSSIEIVPFDSSLVLLLSKRKEIVDSFRAAFPLCQDLREFNAAAKDVGR